jgi:hypothetical protein
MRYNIVKSIPALIMDFIMTQSNFSSEINEFIQRTHELPLEKEKTPLIQDLEMLRLLYKTNELKRKVNIEAGNFDQFIILKNNIEKKLAEIEKNLATTVADPEIIEAFKKKKEQFEQNLLPKMQNGFALFNKTVDLKKALATLDWIPHLENTAKFHTKQELGTLITEVCKQMKKNGHQALTFTIFLPQPSEAEQKNMEKNPNTRIHDYAKLVFENAAKQGYSPKDITLKIDNQNVKCTHEAFKEDLSNWTKIAEEVNSKRLEKSREILAEENPTLNSSSPKP